MKTAKGVFTYAKRPGENRLLMPASGDRFGLTDAVSNRGRVSLDEGGDDWPLTRTGTMRAAARTSEVRMQIPRKSEPSKQTSRVPFWFGVVILGVTGLVSAHAIAQAPPQSFEVVSIKPRVTEPPLGGAGGTPPDRFERPDTTLVLLIRYAHDLFDFQVVGGPDWVRSKRWEVSAKAPGPVAGAAAMRPLVRRMLADRFALKAHIEMRELPIYNLVLARSDGKLGPKIKPAAADCTPFLTGQRPMQESPRDPENGFPLCSSGASFGGGVITPRLNGQPLSGLIRTLEATLQRRVVDKTGLKGKYDIELTYVDEQYQAQRTDASDGAALFTALQDQLGLKLESSRGPVDVLVVDSVSEPTVN